MLDGDRPERRERFRLVEHALVRYGCRRTRSHSPAPSGPRLSQIAFETPSRPKPWTRPARRVASRLGEPLLDGGAGGELGDAFAWPSM